ncbi:hypothetical protein RHSIM_Rhsim07G0190300 [Rhododendron simsii]|uniref:Transmembrane protein n=1 Tax=Rhododendron simsii TaxID=118357 RepID=A0A834GW40_RHOSS|nr:hypothetical protein RHSIM_Rhsim07G0190300 [Rhododendron simsii]
MAKPMVSPTLCLLALLISLQILTNADGKAFSNAGNEDAEIQESPAPPTDEENAALNTIRSDEMEEGFAPFYSRKLREGFRLLKGGKSGGKSVSRMGSSSTSSPAPSPNGSETKSTPTKWYEYVLFVVVVGPILFVVGLFKMLETQAQMAMWADCLGK